jgi:hypothetical protein
MITFRRAVAVPGAATMIHDALHRLFRERVVCASAPRASRRRCSFPRRTPRTRERCFRSPYDTM